MSSRMSGQGSSSKEKTFQYEDTLPSLPVPALQQTLSRYLESVKPFLTDDEFRQTELVVQQFGNGVGKELHHKLMLHAHHNRNWLERWWEDAGYLETRTPLAVLGNLCGITPYLYHCWPPEQGTQIERGALSTWMLLKFWDMLRKEKLMPDKTRDGSPLAMTQWHRAFSTCRVPGETRDSLRFSFKTKTEGSTPVHIVVMYRGRMFAFPVVDNNDELISSPELQTHMQNIKDKCDREAIGPGIGILTTEDRTTWYHVRQHMIKHSDRNEKLLHTIESAIITLSLDDAEPQNVKELGALGLVKGNYEDRWTDKSYNGIVFKNGTVAAVGDHAPVDGIVLVSVVYYTDQMLKSFKGKWTGTTEVRNLPAPEELDFALTDFVHEAISEAQRKFKAVADSVQFDFLQYTGYGKSFIRSYKLHPDAYVQLIMQLGYYRMYGKPAPTYETATTRRFYHGRTETMKSCTTEAISWAKSMLDPSASNESRLRLFLAAMRKHIKLMSEAETNQGVDRHLFGLAQIARQEGYPTPEIFVDKAFTKSGGGGNYILSTSSLGYTAVSGCVGPMCENCYGIFYNTLPTSVTFFITTFTKDKLTNSGAFATKIQQSFEDVRSLLESSPANAAKL